MRTKQKAGGTHLELGSDRPPRLFTRPQDARIALMHWLDGKKYVVTDCDIFGNYVPSIHCEKMLDRKACDMEVVRVQIEEK